MISSCVYNDRDVVELGLALAFQPCRNKGAYLSIGLSLLDQVSSQVPCVHQWDTVGGIGALQEPQLQVSISDVLHLAL